MSTAFSDSSPFPGEKPVPYASFTPVVLAVPGRPVELEMKVSAPVSGDCLPVVLLSHGHGSANFLSSLHGYGPLADYWAGQGFAVIQPTHLDSSALKLREVNQPEGPLYWRSRVQDMRTILDHLDEIETAVPGLAGRLNRDRIAVVGHSMGGHTASLLLGAQTIDPADGSAVNFTDPRIKAGIILAAPGLGDEHLSQGARERYPILQHTDFTSMSTPALVVAGDEDLNPMFSDRLSYRWDAYTVSPGPKSLLMLFGAGHILGGISGYDAAETTDENPERVAALRALGSAYLRSVLYPGDPTWTQAIAILNSMPEPLGSIESK